MMESGESHRHIGDTNMNAHSSRSHTIFRMTIESSPKTPDEGVGNACLAVRVSVLNLVDLAGSERASKTGAAGVRLKEGSHINNSLITLGTVIKKLSEGVENRGGHIPYRDSKLTRILQPALGGNANTAIICNITLAPIHADETKSTLQFASRALRVTNCARVDEISSDAALLKRKNKENEELGSIPKTSHSDHSDEVIRELRSALLKSELERERMAMELCEEKKARAGREKVLQEQATDVERDATLPLEDKVEVEASAEDSRAFSKDLEKSQLWTPAEVDMLMAGVQKFAAEGSVKNPWKLILQMGEGVFKPTRTTASLKAKFKIMKLKRGRTLSTKTF